MNPSEGCTVREARKRDALLNGRFLDRVDRSGGPDSCWPWTGSAQTKGPTGGGGYGFFTVLGKVYYVHRRVVELTIGRTLAAGECALHDCDNPPCCNPTHLRVGTKAENSADMARKGRSGTARLTAVQASLIKARLAAGARSIDLAAEYGVVKGTIGEIKAGRTWRHVEAVA